MTVIAEFASFNYLIQVQAYLRNAVLLGLHYYVALSSLYVRDYSQPITQQLWVRDYIQTSMLLPYFLSWVIISIFVLTFLRHWSF